jgi:dTDP-4-amino-4,6-dideoxygalactose transaminase
VERILESGVLTNGPTVRALEERAVEYLGVSECVAVGSCTQGLMLVLRAQGLTGAAIVPSFTFSATVHAVAWNGLAPRFADVDAESLTLSSDDARAAAGDGVAAIVATHVFGTPCDVPSLEGVARDLRVPLVFDAAHAMGSRHRGAPVGRFGLAEVFSLTPTKLVVAGEGGLIATEDHALAEACRIGREYGNPGDYDTRFIGLNARMSEIHAALALRSMEGLDERVARRGTLARRYRDSLRELPGLSFPLVRPGDVGTYKDMTVLVDPEGFDLDAISLADALAAEGIETRRYYAPPVHAQRAYRSVPTRPLPVTDRAAARVLTLPLWSEMEEADVDRVAGTIARIRRYPEVARASAG